VKFILEISSGKFPNSDRFQLLHERSGSAILIILRKPLSDFSCSVDCFAMSTALDLGSVTLHIADPLSGFCNSYYPIYLNQQGKQPPLTISFSLTAVVNGVCSLIDPAEHDISIVPMLRYGHTPIAVPVPTYCNDIVMVVPNDPNTQAGNQLSTKLSFRISKDCLSDGGLESTVRLRLLAVHNQHNVVLSIADSQRFVIMTKEVPSGTCQCFAVHRPALLPRKI
jgi:hypothetical protein